jgi:hypothetical protein
MKHERAGNVEAFGGVVNLVKTPQRQQRVAQAVPSVADEVGDDDGGDGAPKTERGGIEQAVLRRPPGP